ncbi:hypothetical protein PAN31117_05269 [Pandoraea anapnoica]|uniref:Uncharacterized protein n=1 Tax=Pandoraea anapnoica TaxID=2508301 RepID=A0A5E5AS65_9BURK|nr:hypothetical protein PIN31009_05463 [Pandoraea iniqua]VVE75857.1 hypothetical protein PAN31117_05269 [Pandoraea anapnoica]
MIANAWRIVIAVFAIGYGIVETVLILSDAWDRCASYRKVEGDAVTARDGG